MTNRQRELCRSHGVPFTPPAASSRVGIAVDTLTGRPLHGMRVQPHREACGWYIWCGESSDNPLFFQPLCVEHLSVQCPAAVPFLGLPPGWQFLTDGEHTDVWNDDALMVGQTCSE